MVPKTRALRFEHLERRDNPTNLGGATPFNAFIFDDMTAFTSDVEGRVAVGDHGSFTSYGIGDKLPNSNGTRDDLITGGDLDYTNGQVFNGNIVYGGTGTLESVGIPNGDERVESGVVDFATIRQDLTDKSALWGGETANGTTRFRYRQLMLRGTHPQLNIFTVSALQLSMAKSITVMAPAGSTVLINVTGDHVTMRNMGVHLRGPDCSTTLWNFPDADDLDISGVGLEGSILAPDADLTFNNGQIEGTVIAENFTGNGELHLCPSAINIVIPEYATLSGNVFVDLEPNGAFDNLDDWFDGAEVQLTGSDSLGRVINRWVLSGPNGAFNFGRLWDGTYNVRVVPPDSMNDVLLNGIPGTVNAAPTGTAAINRVNAITLATGDDGIDYLLPLFPNPN